MRQKVAEKEFDVIKHRIALSEVDQSAINIHNGSNIITIYYLYYHCYIIQLRATSTNSPVYSFFGSLFLAL